MCRVFLIFGFLCSLTGINLRHPRYFPRASHLSIKPQSAASTQNKKKKDYNNCTLMAFNQVWGIAGKRKMSKFKEQTREKKFDRTGFPGRYGPIAKCECWHDGIGIELSEDYSLDIDHLEEAFTTRHAHKARDDEDGHMTKKYVKEQNLYERATRRKKCLFLLHTSSPIEGNTQETVKCGNGRMMKRTACITWVCWIRRTRSFTRRETHSGHLLRVCFVGFGFFSTRGTSITYTKWKEYMWHYRFFLMCIRDDIQFDVCTGYHEQLTLSSMLCVLWVAPQQ